MPALIASATSSTSRHLQHKISERLDQCRQIQLAFDIRARDRARDRAHDPTHPRFMATYLSHCGDAHWLATILTDITVPNRLMEIATHRRLLAPLQPTSSLETRRICNDHQPTPATLPLPSPITYYCRLCQASFTAEPSSTASYPIVDPYGDHALGCRRSLPHRTTFWHDPLRDAYASIGRMVGLRTRTEVTGMIPDNSKRPDVVFTTDDGTEIITDVVTCCPVLMSASVNNCAHSATTIGAANASGITSKHQAWGPSLRDLPYEFYALAHEPGRISDTALSLLDRLISRLPTNDRPRLRTYAHQLLAATTALGVARVIRAGLPIRCDSSNRVLPTPGDAIPSNGLPPRPPPGQFRPRSPDRTTTLLATNQPANTPDSPESPRFLLRESPPDQPVAVEEAPVFEGAAG